MSQAMKIRIRAALAQKRRPQSIFELVDDFNLSPSGVRKLRCVLDALIAARDVHQVVMSGYTLAAKNTPEGK